MTKVYIGTYTKKDSKGVYTANFNPETGTLSDLEVFIETKNPTYLDSHKPTNRLFTVADMNGESGINVYDISSPPKLIHSCLDKGTPPCYVHYEAKTDTLFDANYHLGQIHAYQNYTLDKTFLYEEGSHAHYVSSHPKTGDVYVCDLGLDAIRKYRLLNEISTYNTPQGSGPRHIAFHPTEPTIYVFCELSNEIIVLKDDEFEFHHLQTISTLPQGEGIQSAGAAIRISEDGKYLYASNRGHDSIAVFTINDDLTLSPLQFVSAGGKHPRDFDITPDGGYLIVANKDSDNLVVLKRDKEHGTLELLSNDFYAPEAVCIHFIR